MLCTQHKLHLTWWQQGTAAEWVWVSFTSIPREEIKRRRDDNAVGVQGWGGDLPPFNLAARDLIFRSSEKLQLLPISSGIAGAHSSGEKSQTISSCSSTKLSFFPCTQREYLLYNISESRAWTLCAARDQRKTPKHNLQITHSNVLKHAQTENLREANTSPLAKEQLYNIITKWGITAICC